MKKTLLFFLLLFTTSFYAQVSFVSICADQPFNLTHLDKDFIGNLNPAETTISYFLSLDDATNNTNVIANPTQYYAATGVTNIYGRINNNGITTTNYFIITAFPPLDATVSHTPIKCNEETSSITINASGGTGSYEYSLNGGPYTSNNSFKFLIAGTYNIEVTDGARLCRVSIEHTITVPPPLTVTAVTENQNTTIIAAGGTEPYQYSIDGAIYQSSNIFSDLPVGLQPISVRDSRGCSVFTTIAIGDADFPLSAGGMILKNVSCWGSAALRAIGYGGEPPYLYSINGGQSFQESDTFDNLSAGLYPIAIKDSKNTIINNISFELLPYIPVTATVTPISTSSCINSGGLNIVAKGGQIAHCYSIDGGKTYSSDNAFFDLPAGNYSVLVKDSNECISPVITTTILQDLPLSATALHTELLCAQDKTTLTINAIGGEAPYQYAVNTRLYSIKNTYSDLSPGTYQIKVKDAVGCVTTIEHVVAQPTPIYPDILVEDRTITLNGQAGTAPYQYSVDDGAFQVGNVFTNLSSGIHIIKIKDSKGCESYTFKVIIEDKPLVAAVAITKAIDCISNASIPINATGGQSPYTYSLNGGAYQPINSFNNLTAGTYFVTVKDASNTTFATNMITINPPIQITAIAAITKLIDCFSNATVSVIASGGTGIYQYSMNDGPFQTSNIFNNLSAGVYHFSVKDSNVCILLTNNIVIEQPIPLTATVTQTKITDCLANANSYVNLKAAGGTPPYQYSINKLPYSSDNSYPPLYPGTYSFDIKDAKGCVFTLPLIIESPSSLIAIATVNKSTECGVKDSVTITATGGQAPYTYSFDIGVSYSVSNTSLASGVQTFFVKDSNGCQASVHIPVEQSLLSATAITDIYNKTIKVNVTGGKAPYKYTLKKNSEIIIGAQNENVFNNVALGSYIVEVTDANGCEVFCNAELYSPLIVSAVITSPVNSESYGKIEILATGGLAPYQYSINSGAYTSNNVFTNLAQGTYMIEVRDSSNNISSLFIVVKNQNTLTATTVNTNVNCYGSNDGTINVNATGGIMPYTYSLYHNDNLVILNSNSNYFPNLTAGVYKIIVMDATGYSLSNIIFISEPTILHATLVVDNQTITANTTGGSGLYSYSMGSTGYQTSPVFTNVPFGIHEIYVRDQNGCFVITSIAIDPPAPLIDGKNIITIEFKPGQTLADLVINGQNIKWYSNQNPLGGKTTKSSEVTLPLTTLLVDGTTYYASQTINGIESIERLAVTTKLNGSLSAPDFVLGNFKYYPNPVQHTLNIDNTSTIDEIEIISVSGKSVLAKKINNTHSEIDLSNVSSGVYLLKVKSEGQTKTIKIVKK
ncbi:T9SS type A sorting domain-containing protein [Flavobacterium psychroterrae]|uniref:T9SS type A sorting domain-containing protein n=1 Tax=Flavobacterium psychroterrae TaxID=2133767 RepID=A0ABS5P7C7_9FLAO|nr:T9SS type A sorting domain-containing protein [Flavobacterium psychroterrae]MBS7230218.1 T9SS type A sorting domain-containing protein [Flavobacterium psychroterrae]